MTSNVSHASGSPLGLASSSSASSSPASRSPPSPFGPKEQALVGVHSLSAQTSGRRPLFPSPQTAARVAPSTQFSAVPKVSSGWRVPSGREQKFVEYH